MKIRILLLAAGAIAVSASAANAQSYPARVTTAVYLRTGPDTGYPAAAVVPAGATVVVHGCLAGWSWCDVSWGPNRGWLAGMFLAAHYQNRPVPYGYYAPRAGVPVVTFLFGNYWDRHYRGRTWYNQRGHYERYDYRNRRWPQGYDRRDRRRR